MKVCIVSELYPPKVFGGGELSTEALAKALARKGNDVVVITQGAEGMPRESVESGVRVRREKELDFFGKLRSRSDTSWYLKNTLFYHLKAAGPLSRMVSEEKPDIVHAQNLYSAFPSLCAAKRNRVPAVVTLRDFWPVCLRRDVTIPGGAECGSCSLRNFWKCSGEFAPRWMSPLFFVFARILSKARMMKLNRFDATISISEQMRRMLVSRGLRKDGAVTIYNPCESAKAPSKAKMRRNPDTILCVGRLDESKGFDLAIKALKLVLEKRKKARLVIAGDGPERKALERLATNLGVSGRIDFLGKIPHDEMGSLYAESSVFVAPSRWPEPFGRTLVEAMMSGTPVVAARSGAFTEIVEDGKTGLLVQADEKSIADAVLKFLSSPASAKKMSALAIRSAARFAPENIASQHLELYGRLLLGKK